MMPEKDLWPPWTDAWSFHTVIQGGRYFDAMLKALEIRYGKASGIEDFCLKGQLMNYESARGMFEAYGRNKYSATGITTWKYDAAWPASPTWQYIDWYLRAGGAYYGAKKACEELHVQYSYDDNTIYVVNGLYKDFKGLKVSAKVLDLDLKEKFSRQATVDVTADGKTNAFVVERPKDLSKTYFLSLKLQDASGKLASDNLYWLSTVPDIPGTKSEKAGAFILNPASVADLTALSSLPKVSLKPEYRFERRGGESVGHVKVANTTGKLAFFIHLMVVKGKSEEEVLPSYWEDNYFGLLPGESKEVSVRFATEELGGAAPTVRVDGANVTK
jgi:exo-1,4-beta-D-glucosaminidase